MPLRAFWLLSNQIHRVQAESDLRALSVASYAQSSDGIKELRDHLNREMGQVMRAEERFDEEGWNRLKHISGR